MLVLVTQDTYEGFLHYVFSEREITSKQPEKIAGQRAMVPLDEELEGGSLTAIQQYYEFSVTELIQG